MQVKEPNGTIPEACYEAITTSPLVLFAFPRIANVDFEWLKHQMPPLQSFNRKDGSPMNKTGLFVRQPRPLACKLNAHVVSCAGCQANSLPRPGRRRQVQSVRKRCSWSQRDPSCPLWQDGEATPHTPPLTPTALSVAS